MAWSDQQIQSILGSSDTINDNVRYIIIDNDRKIYVSKEDIESKKVYLDQNGRFIICKVEEGQKRIKYLHYISFDDVQGVMVADE